MKFLFTLLVSAGLATTAFSQTAPAIQWQKTYGGSYGEYALAVQPTSDGGYVMAGVAGSVDGDVVGQHGGADYWVVKVDNKGTLQWQKALGGSGTEWATSIQQTSDGGYIVCGWSQVVTGPDGDITQSLGVQDIWVVKLDGSGNLQWQKSLGGSIGQTAHAVLQTADGGYVVAGYSNSIDGDATGNQHSSMGRNDYWVVKLDGNGNLQWQKMFGGIDHDYGYSIQHTSDGGFVMAGRSSSNDGDVTGNHGNYDYWVIKLDGTGTLQWQKSFGGTDDDEAYAVQQTRDGGYIVAGHTLSTNGDVTGNHGGADYWIVKLDGAGNLQWQKALGGTANDYAYSVQQTIDGGYIVAGGSYSNDGDVTGNHGNADHWIVKLDGAGTLQWQKAMGGTKEDIARAVLQLNDGSYIVAGKAESTNGDVTSLYGSWDFWLVKLSVDPTAVSNTAFPGGLLLSPNPATDRLFIQSSEPLRAVRVTDLTGREVYRSANLSVPELSISTTSFDKGLYLLHATTAAGVTTQKFEVN